MKCSQCGTELPSAAPSCPRCGTVHQGTSGTSASPTPFSYLPAGAPPWPTSVPDKMSFVAVADPEATPLAIAEKKPEPKPKRSMRSVLVLAGLIILVPLIGSLYALSTFYINNLTNPAPTNANIPQNLATATSATPSPNAPNTPQLPTPTAFKDVSVKEVNVSLQYPSDWQEDKPRLVQANTYLGSVYPVQVNLGIQFTYLRFSNQDAANFTSPDQVNQFALASLTQDGSLGNPQNIPVANQQPTIAGVQWLERGTALTTQNGRQLHVTTLAVKRNNEYYQILFFAPEPVYNEAMQKYFQPMLSSFKFLS